VRVTVTHRILAARPAEVFAVLTDPTSYPSWLVGAKRIRDVSADWPAPGSTFAHVVGFGPVSVADRTTVLEIDPPARLRLRVRARPAIAATVEFELEESNGETTLRMVEDPVGHYRFLAPLMEPLIRLRNERSLERLQRWISPAQEQGRTGAG
jgi:uncharacterized protein YndB with AHSA1/START domain